jgi:hypothetical protein
MKPTVWVFAGSEFVTDGAGKKHYYADVTGALITTFNDPSTVIDNPAPTGGDDTLFVANTEAVPPLETPVKVIIKVAPPERPAPKE